MPPRRRQPGGDAAQSENEAPRRSERIRLLREAVAPYATVARPIATTSRAVSAPRRRSPVQQAEREAAVETPAARQSGLPETLQNSPGTGMRSPPGGSQENPTTSAVRTLSPSAAFEASTSPFARMIPLPPSRRAPPTEANRRQAAGRLNRELQDFRREPPEGCHVEVVNDNIFNWRARIPGPPDTQYEGGEFLLDFHFAHDYPITPPKVYFLTKIYHCNIAATGYICLDILNKEWSPALTVAKVLLSLISLLGDPNPDDPVNPTVASLYKRHRELHDQTARAYTAQYAKPAQGRPEPEQPE